MMNRNVIKDIMETTPGATWLITTKTGKQIRAVNNEEDLCIWGRNTNIIAITYPEEGRNVFLDTESIESIETAY